MLLSRPLSRFFPALVLLLAGCASAPLQGPAVPLAGGVVSASQPDAAEVAADVLRQGGDAVDAALALQLALTVTEPESSGLGGGALLLIWRAAEQRAYFIDGREAAPLAATPDQFGQLDYARASVSGIAVGVPGTLAAFRLAQQRWGRLAFAEDFRGATRLAEDGFPVRPYVAGMLADAALQQRLDAAARAALMPAGHAPIAGERLRQPDLARTLRTLAQDPDSFYHGAIAAAIVEAQRVARSGPGSGGRMQPADLANYQARLRAPLTGQYRDVEIVTAPSPSAGGVTLLETLGLLEASSAGQAVQLDRAADLHRVLDALRLASADRLRYLGDDTQSSIPVEALLAPSYLRARAALIGARAIPDTALPGEPEKGRNTTHFSVIDAQGNAAIVTSTIETAFGTGIVVPGWGFLLNNELTDFDLHHAAGVPAAQLQPNDPAPGRRPRSSMTPTLVLDRQHHPRYGFGSPGSATIISTVLQVLLRVEDGHTPLQMAIDAPRFALTSGRNQAGVESGWPAPLLDELRSLGHELRSYDGHIGSVQAVAWPDSPGGLPQGAADKRRDGTVLQVPVGGH